MKLWKTFCNKYLKDSLKAAYKELNKLDIKYLSIHDSETKRFFQKEVEWIEAIDVCSNVGIGFSDAMILNTLQSTRFFFVVTIDFDMVYTTISDNSLKDIVVPDGMVSSNWMERKS